MHKIVVATDEYPIKPSDIKSDQHFFGTAFRNNETEKSANWLVRFAQRNGDWREFTYDEIEAFYNGVGGHENFSFNRLLADDFIIKMSDTYYFTHEFIVTCFESSPIYEPSVELASTGS
ncbi:hypothetical protein ACFL14_00880 [Patescibacteria group bacterium]